MNTCQCGHQRADHEVDGGRYCKIENCNCIRFVRMFVDPLSDLRELRIWKFIIQPGYHNERAIPGTEVSLTGQPQAPLKASGCLAVAVARSAEEAMRYIIQRGEERGRGRQIRWVEVADVTSEPIKAGIIALSY